MKIDKIQFEKSSQSISQCPLPNKPEFAFIGRSNVGKSSLINQLTGRKALAKVSSVPGKTQLINHFTINNHWYLVDLPGYGWAKVGQKMRENWEKNINNYLLHRENLECVFVLVDSRHEPLSNDIDFMKWLADNDIPFVVIFTKADKLSYNQLMSSLALYKKIMKKIWAVMPTFFCTSSETGLGREDILGFIDNILLDLKTSKLG
jgi:GTP-binding protein